LRLSFLAPSETGTRLSRRQGERRRRRRRRRRCSDARADGGNRERKRRGTGERRKGGRAGRRVSFGDYAASGGRRAGAWGGERERRAWDGERSSEGGPFRQLAVEARAGAVLTTGAARDGGGGRRVVRRCDAARAVTARKRCPRTSQLRDLGGLRLYYYTPSELCERGPAKRGQPQRARGPAASRGAAWALPGGRRRATSGCQPAGPARPQPAAAC
jgi:hypothetical protein